MGIAGLKKVRREMPGLSPASVPKKSKGSLSQSFPGFQQEVKAEIIHGTSLYDRGIWLSPHPAWWPWCAHTLFGGAGEAGRGSSWSAPVDLSGFLSRLISLEDC